MLLMDIDEYCCQVDDELREAGEVRDPKGIIWAVLLVWDLMLLVVVIHLYFRKH